MSLQRKFIELGIILALIYGLTWLVYSSGKKAGAAPVEAKLAATQLAVERERAQAAAIAASASEHARQVEQARAVAITQAQESYDTQIKIVSADAGRARAAADRLQSALSIAARALRATGSGPSDSSTAGIRETGARAAELFGQCVDRYRSVAAAADRAVLAGQQCEQSYGALMVR